MHELISKLLTVIESFESCFIRETDYFNLFPVQMIFKKFPRNSSTCQGILFPLLLREN